MKHIESRLNSKMALSPLFIITERLPWYEGENVHRQFYPHDSKNHFTIVIENLKYENQSIYVNKRVMFFLFQSVS